MTSLFEMQKGKRHKLNCIFRFTTHFFKFLARLGTSNGTFQCLIKSLRVYAWIKQTVHPNFIGLASWVNNYITIFPSLFISYIYMYLGICSVCIYCMCTVHISAWKHGSTNLLSGTIFKFVLLNHSTYCYPLICGHVDSFWQARAKYEFVLSCSWFQLFACILGLIAELICAPLPNEWNETVPSQNSRRES
jgi:hypothetical protein